MLRDLEPSSRHPWRDQDEHLHLYRTCDYRSGIGYYPARAAHVGYVCGNVLNTGRLVHIRAESEDVRDYYGRKEDLKFLKLDFMS